MSAEVAERPTRNELATERSERDRAGLVTVAAIEASEDWSSFVSASAAADLYHDYRWRAVIEDVFGHSSLYLAARDSSARVRGVLPLVRLRSRLFGDFLVSLPFFNYGGILADSSIAERALGEAAARCGREQGVAHVELRHREH